jgi:hypothetical protein
LWVAVEEEETTKVAVVVQVLLFIIQALQSHQAPIL